MLRMARVRLPRPRGWGRGFLITPVIKKNQILVFSNLLISKLGLSQE